MQFIMGEGIYDQLERLFYRGGIGLYYETTWGGMLAYLIFGLICIFTVIGMIATIKWLFSQGHRRREKKNPFKEYMRTRNK